MYNKLLLRTFEAGHIEIWRQLKEILSKKRKKQKTKERVRIKMNVKKRGK